MYLASSSLVKIAKWKSNNNILPADYIHIMYNYNSYVYLLLLRVWSESKYTLAFTQYFVSTHQNFIDSSHRIKNVIKKRQAQHTNTSKYLGSRLWMGLLILPVAIFLTLIGEEIDTWIFPVKDSISVSEIWSWDTYIYHSKLQR